MKELTTKTTLLFILGTIFLSSNVYADHLIGGYFNYVVTSYDDNLMEADLDFNLKIYRDYFTMGAQFDEDVQIGVWGYAEESWTFFEQRTVQIASIDFIEHPLNEHREIGTYSFSTTLAEGQYEKYLIAYQRCCRVPDIFNIFDSDPIGSAIQIEIYNKALILMNSSPSIERLPWTYDVPAKLIEEDMSFIDDDGDQIIYTWSEVKRAGGAASEFPGVQGCDGLTPEPMICPPPYDQVNYSSFDSSPFGPSCTIDSITGMISGIVEGEGRHLYGIAVSEYRNGQLLSEVLLDYTYINEEIISNVDHQQGQSSIKIFPNPANNVLYLTEAIDVISIYNSRGVEVITGTATDVLDISRLPNGVYFLEILNNQRVTMKKFITFK